MGRNMAMGHYGDGAEYGNGAFMVMGRHGDGASW